MLTSTRDEQGYGTREAGSRGDAQAQQATQDAMKSRKRLPTVGVALFDNPMEMSTGWACLANQFPFRFGSVHDLSNDCMWVVNLSWSTYQNEASNMSHLRRVEFLRTSLQQIAADMGLRLDGGLAEEAAPVLAMVAQTAVHIAVGVYGWEEPTNELREHTLSDDIKRHITVGAKPKSHIRAALISAHQSYSSPAFPPSYEEESFFLTLRYNRHAYCEAVLATPVPDESWFYISGEQASRFDLDELLRVDRPCLVEASIEFDHVDPEIAALIAFGVMPGKRAGLRKWIAQPELAWLSRYARVTVSNVLLCKGARPLPQSSMLPAALFADPLFELSISAGLVAECHMSALMATIYDRKSSETQISSWATWLRATDRAMSFELALKAHQAGFLVKGYGNGSCVIRSTRNRLKDCLEFAEANQIAHPAFYPLFIEHGRTDLLSNAHVK